MKRRMFLKKVTISFFALALTKPFSIFKGKTGALAFNADETKVRATSGPQKSKVVSVRSSRATNWDFKTYPYVDFVDYETVKEMLNTGIRLLTGEKSTSRAWHCLFHSYKEGEPVAIKPNFNDLYKGFKGFVTSPALINAVLNGLINIVGIRPENIIIYDCTRIIPDEFRMRIFFPVKYVEPYGSSFWRKVKYHANGNPLVNADLDCEIEMGSAVRDKEGNAIKCYLPRVVTEAEHLINVPVLKSHQFVSHSGAMKNHYGTVRFSDGHISPEYLHPPIIHQSIADINNDELIRGKTKLIVMDALLGRIKKKGGPPERWNIFDRKSPNRLLISLDPVALDSVSYSMIEKELISRGESIFPHDYLHIANDKGTGAHEHPGTGGKFENIEYSDVVI
jgi:uncharacterized protein (DUF362 family)